jgi:cytoskeleton protein RodZ
VFDIGSSLRDARVRQELDFAELEERTKIRPKYLRALEEEQFDVLPAPTYVRGFLRSYAEALGLEGQPFVDEYNSRFAVGDEDAPIRARRVPARRSGGQRRESRIAVLTLLAIAVVTALVIAAWKFGGPGGEAVPGLNVPGRNTTPRVTHARGQATLVVRAVRGSSWMEVRSGSMAGKLLFSGTLVRSQRQSFTAKRLELALAEPRNVVVSVNGKRVELPAGTAFVVTSRRVSPAAS